MEYCWNNRLSMQCVSDGCDRNKSNILVQKHNMNNNNNNMNNNNNINEALQVFWISTVSPRMENPWNIAANAFSSYIKLVLTIVHWHNLFTVTIKFTSVSEWMNRLHSPHVYQYHRNSYGPRYSKYVLLMNNGISKRATLLSSYVSF